MLYGVLWAKQPSEGTHVGWKVTVKGAMERASLEYVHFSYKVCIKGRDDR